MVLTVCLLKLAVDDFVLRARVDDVDGVLEVVDGVAHIAVRYSKRINVCNRLGPFVSNVDDATRRNGLATHDSARRGLVESAAEARGGLGVDGDAVVVAVLVVIVDLKFDVGATIDGFAIRGKVNVGGS